MKYSEIKDLTVNELRSRLVQMKTSLFEVKMKHKLGQVASPIEIRGHRRDIAKVHTALNQKLAR